MKDIIVILHRLHTIVRSDYINIHTGTTASKMRTTEIITVNQNELTK